jgi:hypothetical protein
MSTLSDSEILALRLEAKQEGRDEASAEFNARLVTAHADFDEWYEKYPDTTEYIDGMSDAFCAGHAAAIQLVADKIDEIISEEFRRGHASADGVRCEIVIKYARRAILALEMA